MTKAEEKALEAYPPLMQYTSLMSVTIKNKTDANLPKREIYIEGYEQAEKDTREEIAKQLAKQWSNGYSEGYAKAEKYLTDKAKFSSGWDGFYYGQGYKQAQTDFIEKACKWIKDNGYMYNGECEGDVKAMAEDFVNYMKGE